MTLLLAFACTRDRAREDRPAPAATGETGAADASAPARDSAPPEPPEPPVPTGDTGAGTDSGYVPGEFDCDTVGPPAGFEAELPGARGSRGLAFDGAGFVYGNDPDGVLVRSDAVGARTDLYGAIGATNAMVFLPDGRLAVALNAGVIAMDVATSEFHFLAETHTYGLVLGPDAKLYAAHEYVPDVAISRIDPVTEVSEVWLPTGTLVRGEARVLAFSPDHARLYVGTNEGWRGRIYQIPLDANLDPAGPPSVFAEDVGEGYQHDGMAVDACGYVYVSDYRTKALYRIHPVTAEVVVLLDPYAGGAPQNYAAAMAFGRGRGFPWTTLYLTQPDDQNHVAGLDLGVPGADWPGTVLHRPE